MRVGPLSAWVPSRSSSRWSPVRCRRTADAPPEGSRGRRAIRLSSRPMVRSPRRGAPRTTGLSLTHPLRLSPGYPPVGRRFRREIGGNGHTPAGSSTDTHQGRPGGARRLAGGSATAARAGAPGPGARWGAAGFATLMHRQRGVDPPLASCVQSCSSCFQITRLCVSLSVSRGSCVLHQNLGQDIHHSRRVWAFL